MSAGRRAASARARPAPARRRATLPARAQALNIPTKINRGTVEIVSDVALITKGEKVGGSEATLLAKLGIKPFSYGLVVQQARARAARRGAAWISSCEAMSVV